MNNLRRILVVADDATIEEGLKGVFSQLEAPWEVEYCPKPAEGLTQLDQQAFDVVFGELKGGAKATADFLNRVWEKHPKTVRFLLGKVIPQEVVVQCVLGAHQYLDAPLAFKELSAALDRAESISKIVRNKNLQTLVSRMRTFPSRPSLYLEVLRELGSPNACAQTIGELISKDLAISTKLIQIVNSAFYGFSRNVSDPSDAVLLLGMEATRSLILSIEAFSKFDKVKPIYFSMDRVWRHSQTVAQSAKKIAELMTNDQTMANDAFTAGLLHDIGKLALALNFEDQYQGALSLSQKMNVHPWDVEAEVFGASHADTGAYLLSLWGLPLPIVEAVGGHHLPASSLEPRLSALTAVHLANQIEMASEAPAADNAPRYEMDVEYSNEFVRNYLPRFLETVKGPKGKEISKAASATGSKPVAASAKAQAVQGSPEAPASEPGERAEEEAASVAAPSSGGRSKGIGLVLAGLAAAAVVFGALFLMKQGGGKTEAPTPPSAVEAGESEAPAPSEAATETQEPAPAPEPAPEPAASENDVPAQPAVETPSEPAATPPAAEVAPTAPEAAGPQAVNADEVIAGLSELKLQGIIYRGTNSGVLINGQSLRVGDEIEGARIVTVTAQEVTVEKAGVRHKLQLR